MTWLPLPLLTRIPAFNITIGRTGIEDNPTFVTAPSSISNSPKGSEREAQGGGSSVATFDRKLVIEATKKENIAATRKP